ncbi:arylesterase [Comamonas composti]|uniref:arylesterase n=1 Tax=Comamonas composti TaxID=408558 RepID=UPI00040BD15C|nr:arylesterase [Comamonas composti]
MQYELKKRRHFIAGSLLLGLSLGMSAQAAKPAGPLLVLGDSLSAEYGLARGTGWVALLEQRLAEQQRSLAVVNASVSGETTSGGLSRLPALLAQHRPSVVILELGGNDALRGLPLQGPQGTQANLQAMVQASQKAGAKVLLVGMQVPPNYGNSYTNQFQQLFPQIARQYKTGLVPFLLAGIGDTGAADTAQWFQADRIHPKANAQPHMLDNVWPELLKLLKQP